MAKLLPMFLLVVGILLLFLFYWNRGSPRIHEAFAVIAIVIVGALFYAMRSEPIEKTLYPVYVLNNQDDVFHFPRSRGFSEYYRHQHLIFSRYYQHYSDLKKRIPFTFPEDQKPVVDLQMIAIIDYLFQSYRNTWNVRKETKLFPFATFFKGTKIIDKDIGNDIEFYTKESLPKSMEKNIFVEYLVFSDRIALPKGTKISYSAYDKDKTYAELRLHKRLNFDIKINVSFSSYGATITGLENFLDQDYISKDLGTTILMIECKADFPRIKAWNPSVIDYKKWAEALFEDLYNSFDWSSCDKAIKEFRIYSHNG